VSYLKEIAPTDPCDRCEHPSKFHAGPDRGSRCMIVDGRVWRGQRVPKGMRAKQCWCDGYFPKR
jgi:hypothetical protein